MAFCDKCGAYIPIGETACPACGYDPEEEARKAKEAEEAEKRRQAEAEARRKAEAEAEAARKKAEAGAEARRRARAEDWAAQQRRQEDARRRAEQERQRQRQYSGGAAQSQYASQRTGQSQAYQSQYTSQRTGSQQWAPPWQETQNHGSTQSQSAYQGYTGSQSQQYADMREKAADSAANQKLSILSYIPWVPTFLIPLLTRKDDDFARYHANQGLSLWLVTMAASALGSVSELFPFAGGIFALYGMIRGIGSVLKGKKEPLPLIGKWKLIK